MVIIKLKTGMTFFKFKLFGEEANNRKTNKQSYGSRSFFTVKHCTLLILIELRFDWA